MLCPTKRAKIPSAGSCYHSFRMTYATRSRISLWSNRRRKEALLPILAKASSSTRPSKCHLQTIKLISRRPQAVVVPTSGEERSKRRERRRRKAQQCRPNLTRSPPPVVALLQRLKMSFWRSPTTSVASNPTLITRSRQRSLARSSSKRRMKPLLNTRSGGNLLGIVVAKSKPR